MPKHITLIGMMGAGKSSVAPFLASLLGRGVVEVDQMIEQQEKMSIGDIFIEKGEAYFRRAECDLIARLIEEAQPAVLSLGGGAFQWEATRKLLLEKTVVFYLSASLEVLCSRLQTETAMRPLLNTPGIDFQQTVKELLQRRETNYNLAHYRIVTDSRAPQGVAEEILNVRETYE